MDFKCVPIKINNNSEKIDIGNNRVVTLIGGNGSGKSSILEWIFKGNLDDDNLHVIAFSSGQNESFSGLFEQYKKESRKYNYNTDSADIYQHINSFYFNTKWVRLLIFISATLFKNWEVNQYLKEKLYKDLKLAFPFKLWNNYIKKIKREQEKEEKEWEAIERLYRKTNYHHGLEKLIQYKIDENFDFWDEPETIKQTNIEFSEGEFRKFSLDTYSNDISRIFDFFSRATYWVDENIDLEKVQLFFENREFNNLSDGEYQLLALYALFDIFDSENRVFLFDEVDSHLHSGNLIKLWEKMKSLKAYVITATHQAESILKNNFDQLYFVDKGKICDNWKKDELLKKISSLSWVSSFQGEVFLNIENIVVMDDEVDWMIFKKLAKKKTWIDYDKRLDGIICIKRSSGYENDTHIIGEWKLKLVSEIPRITGSPILKNIFLVCDRDNFPQYKIWKKLGWLGVKIPDKFASIPGEIRSKTHLLVWKRLEIENYLLTKEIIKESHQYDYYDLTKLPANLDNVKDFANDDVKSIMHPKYKEWGFDEKKLNELIDNMRPEEISEDIKTLYDFIVSKL